MFRRAKIPNRLSTSQAHISSYRRFPNSNSRKKTLVAVSAVVAAGCLTYSASKRVILNDVSTPQTNAQKTSIVTPSNTMNSDPDTLHTLVWGSNTSRTLLPDGPDVEPIRRPLVASWLDNVALKDLVFHQDHAACVDARGDVYQWGKFFQTKDGEQTPTLTLKGKNIVQLQLSEDRVYALSSSGKIYASDLTNHDSKISSKKNSSQWLTGWITGTEESSNFVEVVPKDALSWGEKFVSISAGHDHLLALSSTGRAFAHPISWNANSHGQLGFRKFEVPSRDPKTTQPVELVPKSVADPYAKASPFKRLSSSGIQKDSSWDDSSVKNCPTVFEIPSLRDIKISSLKAGGRSSFALTDNGRVLGWGANEYGQIGLGPNVTMDSITVPTEVILWRTTSSSAQTKCVDISAGGDLTCFTVERTSNNPSSKVFEVLTCGNGQWGGLGNNVFSNAQGTPTRARNVSGLLEYNDIKKSIEPIVPQSVSVSPTGHVLLTLDTSAGGIAGRDLVAWGKNYDSELGNGKKASSASPTAMSTSGGERFMLTKKKAKEVRDLQGNVWKRGVGVEQKAVTGYWNSAVYWKVS